MIGTANGIGERFKKLRRLFAMTQQQMSAALGATQASISQIENGEVVPTGNFLVRLKEQFPDVDLNWLIADTGEPLITREPKSLQDDQIEKTVVRVLKNFKVFNDELKKGRKTGK
jgi:transcriptional regulator with XRE-family HTH domain